MRCSVDSRNEPLLGTATHALRWIVVEHPGPWPRNALDAANLDPRLRDWQDLPGVRVLLARHPSRRGKRERVWLFNSERHELVSGDAALLDQVPEWLVAPLVATPTTEPIVFVCTHAKRDQCCAIEGRRVVDELANSSVWECSHLGGHRFAPTALLLPAGLHLGRLDSAHALRALHDPTPSTLKPFLRGDVRWEPRQQIAAALAAQAWECTNGDIDTVDLRSRTHDGVEEYAVSQGQHTLRVEVVEIPLESRIESCGALPHEGTALLGRLASACN